MAYDRADWHYGGDYPEDLPSENGGTHIGMFLTWAIMNGLEGEFHRKESPFSLAAVRSRKMTGRQFLFKECDGKLWEEDLSTEGNAFAKCYYQGTEGQGGEYFADYEATLASDLPSTYHVEDTWQNYEKIALVINARFERWKRRNDA